MERGSAADSHLLFLPAYPWPGEDFVCPRIGLPPLKTTSLKDAEVALVSISDRVPLTQVELHSLRMGLNDSESPLEVNSKM